MKIRPKRKPIGLPSEELSPLNFAVAKQASSTLEMVQEAIAHNQTLLAYQPIMRSDLPSQVAFYEGLIRFLDPTGRVIPAGEFMAKIEDSETGREIDVLALRHGLNSSEGQSATAPLYKHVSALYRLSAMDELPKPFPERKPVSRGATHS